MSSYVDVERSAEALQEDEELIEAVNEIVETAATAIYTDLKNDVSGVVERIQWYFEYFFPFVVEWRQDYPTRMWIDVQHCGLVVVLYLVAIWMLAPSRRWRVGPPLKSHSHPHPHPHLHPKLPVTRSHQQQQQQQQRTTFSFESLWRRLYPFYKRKSSDDDDESNSLRKRPTLEKSHSTSSLVMVGNKARRQSSSLFDGFVGGRRTAEDDEDEEETEEEKFAKRWPTILQTRYALLVLPPHCKRVEKPKRNPPLPLPAGGATTSAGTETVADVTRGRHQHGEEPDEENPAQRLVNYTRQFLHLMMSFLRYDYVGAGWTLIHWVEFWVRNRKHRQQHRPMEEDDDECESEAGDSGVVAHHRRQWSVSSQSSFNSESSNSGVDAVGSTRTTSNHKEKKHKMRSKRDNFHRPRRSKVIANGQVIDKATTTTVLTDAVEMSNDTMDPQPHVSLLTIPPDSAPTTKGDLPSPLTTSLSSREGEEKKESSDMAGMATPPQTPLASNSLHPDSIYETPRLDIRDETRFAVASTAVEPLSMESLVTKLALNPRYSGGSSSSSSSSSGSVGSAPSVGGGGGGGGAKAKDALESYRTAVARGKTIHPATLVKTSSASVSSPLASPTCYHRLSEAFNDFETPTGIPGVSTTSGGGLVQYDAPPAALPSLPDFKTEQKVPTDSSYYFETASTRESLKRMAVEVPVPDRNGYIVGDDFLPPDGWTPLLVFVNSRSGPQQGHLLITQLRGLLNPIQVWDLADGGPEEILESFLSLSRLRILVCGGDGTVSWIVSTMEKMNVQRRPPIAILPLGTGNDLARIHGWGGGYNNESLTAILEQVAESYVSWLDRWEMTVENKKGKVKETKSFFNYLGVGADAQAALQVHLLRESRPQLFFSRLVNKAWYGIFGAEDIVKATSVNLPHEITLIADGVEVPLPADSQGIILLNIDSYAGGVPLWSLGTRGESKTNSPTPSRQSSWDPIPMKRSRSLDMLKGYKARMTKSETMPFPLDRVDSVEDLAAALKLTDEEKYTRVTACERPSSCQDGFLDIVSIRGAFHLGQIRVGLSNAQRLCQCREATIVIKRKVSVQIDGEPWRQNVCTLRVKRKKDAAIMLHRSANDSNGVETEMANLLDWAGDRKLIDDKVHAALMKEFSRRIESKTRQRREQNNRLGTFSNLKRAIGSSGNLGLTKAGTQTGIIF